MILKSIWYRICGLGSDATSSGKRNHLIPLCAEYGIQNYKGEMEYMPNPTSELVLDKLNLLTEEEKEFHADYFSGNFPQRTPEAYMKIRNHILREWSVLVT